MKRVVKVCDGFQMPNDKFEVGVGNHVFADDQGRVEYTCLVTPKSRFSCELCCLRFDHFTCEQMACAFHEREDKKDVFFKKSYGYLENEKQNQ